MKRRRPSRHIRRVRTKHGRKAVLINKEIPPKVQREIIQGHYQTLTEQLKKDEKARIKDFGVFKVKSIPSKPGGKTIVLFGKKVKTKYRPASRKIKFFPAKKLKKELL